METTVKLYSRTVKRFLNEYGEPTLENINRFVSDSFRERNSNYVKYSFKFYLKFIGKEEIYKEIVPVKTTPRKKHGIYLSQQELLQIVKGIQPLTYRIVALVQLCTGARASEVLSFKKSDIIRHNGDVVFKMFGKGGKEIYKHIPPVFQEEILSFIEKKNSEFPFIRGQVTVTNRSALKRLVNNNYRYYFTSLKRSAKRNGYPDFASHDFRRNFANHLQEKNFNIRNIQKAMGHSMIETTLRYIDESRETHKEAINLLWGD